MFHISYIGLALVVPRLGLPPPPNKNSETIIWNRSYLETLKIAQKSEQNFIVDSRFRF